MSRRTALAVGVALALAGAAVPAVATTAVSTPPAVNSNVGAAHSPRLMHLAGPTGTPAQQPAAITGALQGVDVASFQHPGNAAIDWSQVAASGIQFAFVKATEGDYYANPFAAADLADAKAAGLSVLAYAFAIPNGGSPPPSHSASPVVQADDLVSAAGASSAPLVLDIEFNPNSGSNQCYGLSQPAMVTWISQFDTEIQHKTGRLPLVYTSPSWWQACTGGSTGFGQIPLWVPDFSASDTSPVLAAGWTDWSFWQYTNAGTVAGISGNVDLDQLNPTLIPLLNPGPQQHSAGSPVDYQMQLADPVPGSTPAFTATGLPRGVSVSPSGLITGWPTAPGTYHPVVSAAAGQASGPAAFSWTVTKPAATGPAGTVQLRLAGKCLNDTGNRSANGSQASIWTCAGGSAEHWTYVQDGTLRIHGKCLTVPASSTRVELEPCTDATRQQWRLAYPRAVRASAGAGPTTLVSRWAGECLSDPASRTRNGTLLVISSCDGKPHQAWTLPAGPAASQIPGKCLDDSLNQTADGTKIDISTCNGSAAQSWTVQPDGTVLVHGKCLTISGNGTAAGTAVELDSCHGITGQQWRMIPSGSGAMLKNLRSGRCLADPADATTDGTQLEILTCSTTDPGMAWRVS
ncbi:MAG TPA: ricin-type beta-trefoil lectin domain protein [Streptosporangiaceae bacterium]